MYSINKMHVHKNATPLTFSKTKPVEQNFANKWFKTGIA
jgi:hypothetical protein